METSIDAAIESKETGIWCHKFKHMGCQLHFEVLSWHEGFKVQHCPECGGTEGFMQWSEMLPGQIFEYVPGETPMGLPSQEEDHVDG